LLGIALANGWAVSWWSNRLSGRHCRPAERLLLRLGWRRRVEDDQWWSHLEPDLRCRAGRLDWRHCHRAIGSQHYLCWLRRARPALRSLEWQWDVQEHRRGRDLAAHRPR